MNIDYTIVAFLVLFSLVLFFNRRKLKIQKIFSYFLYIIMLRTKAGLKLMDFIALKAKKAVRFYGYVSVAVGVLGILLIVFLILQNTIMLLLKPDSPSGMALVLPGMTIPGIGYLPFWYWIISIFILAVIHEFAHGVVSRAHGIKIKSSGLAVLSAVIPIIPAAFVEPDERQLKKAPDRVKHSIFAAGPVINIIAAFLILPLMAFLMIPAFASMIDENKVVISPTEAVQGMYPAKQAGVLNNTVVTLFNGKEVNSSEHLLTYISELNPKDNVTLGNENITYTFITAPHPSDETKAFLGINIITQIKEDTNMVWYYVLNWLIGLFYWLHILNLGIGLANLLPLGPVDGGRMLQTFLRRVIKDKKKADALWKYVSIITLVLLLFGLLIGPFQNLIGFLGLN